MSSAVTVELTWTYTPKTFLEESMSLSIKGGTLEIKDGQAIARIEETVFNENPSLRETLNQKIKNRLLVAQLDKHQKFELSKSARTDISADGSKHHYLEVNSLAFTLIAYPADILVKDKEGNVIGDTRQERLDRQASRISLLDKYKGSDPTLDQILRSYQNSLEEPDIELVRLYEIKDALAMSFGGNKKAKNTLEDVEEAWDKLHKIANDLPLNQGRHKGSFAGKLRDATLEELDKARAAARSLIEAYFAYLDA